MKKLIKTTKGIIDLGLIEPSKDGFYDVDGEVVRIIKKQGRTILSCSCASCSRFCNEMNICSRKLAVLLFEAQNIKQIIKHKKLLRENLEYFENCKKIKMQPEIDTTINLIKDLQRFIK